MKLVKSEVTYVSRTKAKINSTWGVVMLLGGIITEKGTQSPIFLVAWIPLIVIAQLLHKVSLLKASKLGFNVSDNPIGRWWTLIRGIGVLLTIYLILIGAYLPFMILWAFLTGAGELGTGFLAPKKKPPIYALDLGAGAAILISVTLLLFTLPRILYIGIATGVPLLASGMLLWLLYGRP